MLNAQATRGRVGFVRFAAPASNYLGTIRALLGELPLNRARITRTRCSAPDTSGDNIFGGCRMRTVIKYVRSRCVNRPWLRRQNRHGFIGIVRYFYVYVVSFSDLFNPGSDDNHILMVH